MTEHVIDLNNQFEPDFLPHPGESLRNYIEEAGMTVSEFVKRAGWTEQHVHKVLSGNAGISPEFALILEKVFNVPARFWNNLQGRYDEVQCRQAEKAAFASSLDWAKAFPYTAMVKKGWLPNVGRSAEGRLDELLKFFGVASPEVFERFWDERIPAFRASGKLKSDLNAVACWIRRAEIEAARAELPAYDRPQFLEAIREIRAHVTGDLVHYQERMEALCRQAGVRLIFLPHLPKMNIGGVTFWLRPQGNPVIVLSLRWNSDDHLWFNFFHEAKHVLQEMKKRLFLDLPGDAVDDPKEQEANKFAANLLIPTDRFVAFCSRCPRPRAGDIAAFARDENVTPGIVLGQLQHCGILGYGTALERLKKRFVFTE